MRGKPDADRDEAIGIGVGEGVQHETLDQAVDQAVRANRHAEREDGDGGKSGPPAELAERVPDVLKMVSISVLDLRAGSEGRLRVEN